MGSLTHSTLTLALILMTSWDCAEVLTAIGYTDWKVWIYHLWHPALMPVQCLLDGQCPWSCRFCSSLNPHTNPKCSLLLLLRSPSQVFAPMKKLWSEQSWSCSVKKILIFKIQKWRENNCMSWNERKGIKMSQNFLKPVACIQKVRFDQHKKPFQLRMWLCWTSGRNITLFNHSP